MPEFKKFPGDDKLAFNFSYLKFKKFIDYYWITDHTVILEYFNIVKQQALSNFAFQSF